MITAGDRRSPCNPNMYEWYNPPTLLKGDTMKVDVYWNLHRRLFSVRSREKETYGRVISHATHLGLFKPKPVVSQAGRERVLREKRKNVHAVIRGDLDMFATGDPGYWDRFTWNEEDRVFPWVYNPYEMHDFHFKAEHPKWGGLYSCSEERWSYVLLEAVNVAKNHRVPKVQGAWAL